MTDECRGDNALPVNAAKAVHAIMPPRAAANTSCIRRSIDPFAPNNDDNGDEAASSIISPSSRNVSDIVDVDNLAFVVVDDKEDDNIDDNVLAMAFVPPTCRNCPISRPRTPPPAQLITATIR